jgi:hypothetical protein
MLRRRKTRGKRLAALGEDREATARRTAKFAIALQEVLADNHLAQRLGMDCLVGRRGPQGSDNL